MKHSQVEEAFAATFLAAASLLLTAGASSGQRLRLDELHRMLPPDARDTQSVYGDVDGDGDLDVLLIHRGGAVSVSWNDGSGAFGVPVALPVPRPGPLVEGALLVDVEGDGDLDVFVERSDTKLVLGGFGYYTVVIGAQNLLLVNDGSGRFANQTALRLPAVLDQTHACASADVDGDGDLDLLIGNESLIFSGLPADSLYLNDGSGFFTELVGGFPDLLPTPITTGFGAGDVDADDDVDLFVYSASGLRLLINQGSGTFVDETFRLPTSSGTPPFALGDVDEDGDLDALNGVAFWVNDGAGFFSVGAGGLPAGGITGRPVLADVDADGHLDVCGIDPSGTSPRLFRGDGTGGFVQLPLPAGNGMSGVSNAADLDGDGDLDLLLGSRSQAELLLGDGTGRFLSAEATVGEQLRLPTGIEGALGDLSGDGNLDLVTVAGKYTPHLAFGDGEGIFSDASANLSVGPGNLSAVGIADVEGDGDADVFIGARGPLVQTNRLLLNDGSGSLTEVAGALPEVANCESLTLADLDADGFVDVLFGESNRLYLNDGAGGLVLQPALAFTGIVYDSLAADLDGNGTLDLVIARSGLQRLSNDGSASFTVSPVFSDGECVAAADVDGDGDVDLAAGTGPNDSNLLLQNDGTGLFYPSFLPGAKRDAVSVAFIELNGNGRPDLLFGNRPQTRDGADQLLLNKPSGFADVSDQLGTNPDELTWDVLVGDVDGDGDDDAVMLGGRAILPYPELIGVSRLYSNLFRQVAWRTVPGLGKRLVLDQYGTPGTLFWLLAAPARAEVELPPLGTLRLDPSQLTFFAAGTLDADGRSSVVTPVPLAPGLVGLTIYFQSALGQPVLLSNLETVTFTAF